MCGIAGASFSRRVEDGCAAVARMGRAMVRRGPDADGQWADADNGIVLGHRRLSIIDLNARANQPMVSSSSRLTLVFNGEIYNYRELKLDLERQGRTFVTGSDTEVILQLVEQEGIDALARLRGMFAFALWDSEQRALYLARDPYGIKPLYTAACDAGILFASQVKALIASGLVSKANESAGIAGFLLWGSVPAPWTVYRDIRAVPSGSWMRIRAGRIEEVRSFCDVRRFWAAPSAPIDSQALADKVRAGVVQSVRRHLVADVPIGVFLSGGVDSGAIAGLMAELGHPTEGFTVAFDAFRGTAADEVPRARQLAKHFGIRHTVRTVDRAEFEADLPAILDAMDQPSIDGVNTWFAAKLAAERGYKVVLSGAGGDELLGGYGTFRTVPRLAQAGRILGSRAAVQRSSQALLRIAAKILGTPKLPALPTLARTPEGAYFLQRALFLPEDLPGMIDPDLAAEGLARLAAADASAGAPSPQEVGWPGFIAGLESTRYLHNQLLRDADWASMAHSIELRTPLVDHVLSAALAPHADQLMGGAGKRYLAAAPQPALPAGIANVPKTGFGLPMAAWIANSKTVQSWRKRPALQKSGTPWTRRWAQVVGEFHSIL
jgi:asparagine synthase (glutamine-hydrolysing)